MSGASGLLALLSFAFVVMIIIRAVSGGSRGGSSWARPRGDVPDDEPAPDEAETPKKKRKKKKRKRAEAEMAEMTDDSSRPRAKHYAFAHQFLRQVTVTKKEVWNGVRAAAAAGAIDDILRRMWEDMDEMPGQDSGGPPTGEAIDGGVLIRMSEPSRTTECHLIAILASADQPRYFTLERSLVVPAVLCEWTEEAHVNYGECAVEPEIFLAAARSKLEPSN